MKTFASILIAGILASGIGSVIEAAPASAKKGVSPVHAGKTSIGKHTGIGSNAHLLSKGTAVTEVTPVPDPPSSYGQTLPKKGAVPSCFTKAGAVGPSCMRKAKQTKRQEKAGIIAPTY